MKKIKIMSVIFALSTVFFSSCSDNEPVLDMESTQIQTVADTSRVMFKASSANSLNCSPAVNTFTDFQKKTIQTTSGIYQGNYFRTKVKSLSSTKIIVTLSPASVQFAYSGVSYLKLGSVSGKILSQSTVLKGQVSADISYTIPSSFKGIMALYPVFISSLGVKYSSLPILLYSTEYLNIEKINSKLSFGSEYGSVNGIPVFSNGSSTGSGIYNFTNGINTGMKWQCVEFVNRYYLNIYGINIRIAGDDAYQYFSGASKRGLKAYSNGSVLPLIGDLLCMSGGNGKLGHVLIIVAVFDKCIFAASQNNGLLNPVLLPLPRSGNKILVGAYGSTYTVQGVLRKADGGN